MSRTLSSSFPNSVVVDLVNIDLPIVTYQDYGEWERDSKVRKALQEQFLKATYIVILYPIWWGAMPAILKNYIDQILTPDFAYKFTANDKAYFPKFKAKLSRKSVLIINTADTSNTIGWIMNISNLLMWKLSIGLLTGIKTRFITMGSVKYLNKSKKNKKIEKILSRATKIILSNMQ